MHVSEAPLMVAVGLELTVSALEIVDVQPEGDVTVTVYVVCVFTLIAAVVAPVLQR